MSETTYVLDLGTSKVVCLAASMEADERLHVDAVAAVCAAGMRRGVIANPDEVAHAAGAAIRRLQGDLGREATSFVVNIGGAHLESSSAQGFVPIYPRSRPIRREDVLQVVNHSRQLVMPPDREQVQAMPREFRVDGQRGIANPIGMAGSKLEVVTHVITGQTQHVQAVEKVVTASGAKVEQMVVQALASGVGVLSKDAMHIGCVCVDIGAGTTDVAVFADGAVMYTASIPVAGGHITSDVAQLLKVAPEEAERLKIEYGCALAELVPPEEVIQVTQEGTDIARPMKRRVLAEIIQSRVKEIVALVERSLEQGGHVDPLPGGVVITGGSSQLQSIDKAFAAGLAPMKAKVAKPRVTGTLSRQVDRAEMSTAVGLAMFALATADDEYEPVSGYSSWKNSFHALKSLFGGKS